MGYEDIRSLEEQLDELCLVLDKQISVIANEGTKVGIDPVEVRTSDGGWALAPLLSAKALALHALVTVKEGARGSFVQNIYAGTSEEQS